MSIKTRVALLVLLVVVAAHLACNRQPPPDAKATGAAAPSDQPESAQAEATANQHAGAVDKRPADGPLRRDYVAVINDWMSQGVTPGNNSSVPFWRAVGPEAIAADNRRQYFAMLGVAPPPDEGEYFVKLDEFAALHDDVNKEPIAAHVGHAIPAEQLKAARHGVWIDAEFPLIAAWLARNEAPLAGAVEASRLSRRYDPLILAGDGLLVSALEPAVNMYRACIVALVARANRFAGQGETEKAWQDLLAGHRLCRLLGQGPFVYEVCFGMVSEGVDVCSGDQLLLQTGGLSAEQARQMRLELDSLPDYRSLVDAIDHGDRSVFGDWIANLANRRVGFSSLANQNAPASKPNSTDLVIANTVDWNQVFQLGDAWFDSIVQEYGQPTAQHDRFVAAYKVDKRIRALTKQLTDITAGHKTFTDPDHSPAENVGNTCILLLLPTSLINSEIYTARSAMRFELVRLGCALAAFRAERGSYPLWLRELVPQYASEIPPDFFPVTPRRSLNYERQGEGYLLWSVGKNGVDDHGENDEDDESTEQPPDDISFRVPAARPRDDQPQEN